MKWRTIGFVLGLSLLVCTPTLAAKKVVQVGPPGGVDDTEILQNALNQCNSPSGGCTVQLSAGTYVTKQLVTPYFYGTIKGMGMDKTSIEAYAPLPVSTEKPVWNGPPVLLPELIQFQEGDISIADLAMRCTAPVATEEWFWDDAGQVGVHGLAAFLDVWGTSANLSLNRVKVEGGFVADDDMTPWGRCNIWFAVVAEPNGALSGTMRVKSSIFFNVDYAVALLGLDSSKVTIGGSPLAGNRFEDVEQPISLDSFENSLAEVSYNDIVRTNWLGIELNPALWGPTQTASKFVVQHNNITVTPNPYVDSGWWPDAIDIFDWNWDDPTSAKSEFIVSDNTIWLSHDTGSGIGLYQDAGSIVSSNRISGVGFAGLLLDGSTQDLLLGNNVARFTPEETPFGIFAPIWLSETTSQNTVVGGNDKAHAVDLGINNTLVGVNNMQGNPPGPAIRDAMRRKMEILKAMRKF
jgi:hypothetical protein